MAAVLKQVPMPGLDDPEAENAEIEAGYIWREQLWSACRRYVLSYERTYPDGTKLKGYEAAAKELNARWEPKGRPVSASILRAALNDAERNNFRAEWLDWFAWRCSDVADLMARRVKPAKTADELLEDVIAEMREEMSHKRVEQVLRKARAR